MIVARIYALVWFFVAAVAGVMYLTGYFNSVTLTVFGFIIAALTFIGMIAVLPSTVGHHYSPRY